MPAQSKQQQKFMGIVRAIQKGEQPASKFSKKAQDAADDMKKKDVEKFASTKHKGLPKKVEQALREKIKSMVEDYVESCGYVVSAKDPNYKLKSPGGTGEEDRELKEEGFGSNEFLTKTEKKKFEKERLENAEVLGYTLTGTKDLKESTIQERTSPEEMYDDMVRTIKKSDEKKALKRLIDEYELGRVYYLFSTNRRGFFQAVLQTAALMKAKNLKESINEDGHTDVPSAVRKLKTSIEDALQIIGYLKKVNDAEPLPSWWTDKVTLSSNYLNTARNYILNPHESINEMSDKSKKVINKLGKKEKEVFLNMVDMLGFDQVMSDYKRDKKAFKQALKDMTESVFAVRQDKIKNGERFPKEPNFNYDPEKGKSRIRKVNEKVVKGTEKVLKFTKIKDKSLVKHLKDITKKVGADLQKYSDGYRVSADGDMKKLSAVVDYVMNKSIKKGIMTGGGMSNINLVKEFRNKREADIARDQIGHKALYMIGAKDFVFGKSGGKNSLVFKIMRNSKGVSHIRITLTSLDLYDMEFLAIRAGKIRVKSKEKGVYGDQLGVMIKKNTGLNVRL